MWSSGLQEVVKAIPYCNIWSRKKDGGENRPQETLHPGIGKSTVRKGHPVQKYSLLENVEARTDVRKVHVSFQN
jgi:hypothetical protein